MRLLQTRQTLHRRLSTVEQSHAQLTEQLQQAQRLSGLGLAWAVTAHELNNLLTPMTNYAKLAIQYPDDGQLRQKALEKTAILGQRAGQILEKIMALAAGKDLEQTRVPAESLIQDVLMCIGRDFEKDNISLEFECPAGVTLYGDSVLISQVLLNLILNARKAMLGKGGRLRIAVQATPQATLLEIADTGRGMTADVLTHIFDPFFSAAETGAPRDGNGLGLVFCKHIVESHNGSIQVESEPGRGTTFRILLPNG